MPKIRLEFISPEGYILDTDIRYLRAPGVSGEFGLLHNHSPFFTALKKGIVEIEHFTEQSEREYFDISGGFLEMSNNKIVLLAEMVEKTSPPDKKR